MTTKATQDQPIATTDGAADRATLTAGSIMRAGVDLQTAMWRSWMDLLVRAAGLGSAPRPAETPVSGIVPAAVAGAGTVVELMAHGAQTELPPTEAAPETPKTAAEPPTGPSGEPAVRPAAADATAEPDSQATAGPGESAAPTDGEAARVRAPKAKAKAKAKVKVKAKAKAKAASHGGRAAGRTSAARAAGRPPQSRASAAGRSAAKTAPDAPARGARPSAHGRGPSTRKTHKARAGAHGSSHGRSHGTRAETASPRGGRRRGLPTPAALKGSALRRAGRRTRASTSATGVAGRGGEFTPDS